MSIGVVFVSIKNLYLNYAVVERLLGELFRSIPLLVYFWL